MATYRLICVLATRLRRCPTLLNPVFWQSWMAACPGYTLQMKTLFPGWPTLVHDTHTRRRMLACTWFVMYPFHFLLHIFNQGRSCVILFCTCKLSGRSEAKAENLWDGSSDIDMCNNKKRQKTECGHTERTSDGKRYQWNVTEYRHTNWSTLGMWLAWKRTDIQISWCMGTHMDDSLEGDQGKRGWTTLQKIVKSWT